MWLVTAREMQSVDRETIDGGHVPSLTLMENAGAAVAREAQRMLDASGGGDRARVEIVCGKGNNGGDGLVAARLLAAAGVRVRVHAIAPPSEMSADARACAVRLDGTGIAVQVLPADVEAGLDSALADATLCVDALLGTGIDGAPHGRVAAAIAAIERAGRPTLAVDIASGVDGETGAIPGIATRADVTLTFGAAKLGHAFHPGRGRTGRLVVADIGFPAAILERAAGRRYWVDRALAAGWLPALAPTAHKYARGGVIVVAGSRRYTGAAALAAAAVLRAGAGIVHVVTPESVRPILQQKLSEAIVHGAGETAAGTVDASVVGVVESLQQRARALVVGPGLDAGGDPATLAGIAAVLARVALPAVVDADALEALPAAATHPAARVVTPHAGELRQWTGEPVPAPALERIAHARAVAARRGIVLLAKGAPTIVTDRAGRAFVNSSGHAGLATAGTGDVLAGVVGAFLAQGVEDAAHAAALGAWVHGRAAEWACAGGRSPRSLLAGDLLSTLGIAIGELES